MRLKPRTFALVTLAIAGAISCAHASPIVYQNTTTQVGAFEFNGATTIGSDLAANIDLNQLTLASGSAGDSITSLSFLADNFNSVSVLARPTIYVWAANGAGGNPGTLLGTFALSNQTLAPGVDTVISPCRCCEAS